MVGVSACPDPIMSPRLLPLVLVLPLLGLNACALRPAAPTPVPETPSSALLAPSQLPYGYPDFSAVRDEAFLPAFRQAMAEHRAEIDAIAADPAPPDFVNTIEAMEAAGQTLDRVQRLFFMLLAAHSNDTLRATQAEVAPALAAHLDALLLDRALFARVDAVHAQRLRLGLDTESLRLVEVVHRRFVRAGARLDEAGQVRLRELNARQASLVADFQQRLQADTRALALHLESETALAGLGDNALSAAAAAAASRGLDGYLLTLQLPSGQPALGQLAVRETRERLMRASLQRGARGNEYDTRELIRELVALRAERAQLLGYAHHAAFMLEDQTAETPQAVSALLSRLSPAARRNAEAEADALQARRLAAGERGELAPWDWAYWAEAERKARFDLDAATLRPYFELYRVLEDGAFYMAERLYGLRFERREDLPVYHPDVRVYEVFDADGSGLGLFLFDPYARDSKRGGAWMNALVSQSGLLQRRAVVTNNLNVPRPPDGQPTLLTVDEANTLFHEFGHALHGLFSNVRYPSFAGTLVPRDFVEYPSQVHEMGLLAPEILARYARHVETGEPLPAALAERIEASKQFNQGFASLEYLAAALLDQAWHRLPPGTAVEDVLAFEAAALAEAGVDFAPVPPRYRSSYFNHIFGGMYAAGYYAYIWSEVLDADSVAWFEENGGLTRENGEHFRRSLLSRGGAEEAMSLYRQFRGRDPDIAPLLQRRGLVPQ